MLYLYAYRFLFLILCFAFSAISDERSPKCDHFYNLSIHSGYWNLTDAEANITFTVGLFKTVERMTISPAAEPYYLQLNNLTAGITYVFESQNGIQVWRSPCAQRDYYRDMLENYQIFMFNGTDKEATPLWALPARSNGIECSMGIPLTGLTLFATESFNYSNPEMANLLIMDKSTADNFYPLSVFFLDSHWSESYHVYSGDAADFVTQPRHLVMTNYEENDKNDFIFLGLADWSRERKEELPVIEVYTGWPSGTELNLSNQIAIYSEYNRFTQLPQRYQGKVLTFAVYQPTQINGVGPLFISSNSRGSFLSQNLSAVINSTFTYGERKVQDFEPFNGRAGFIRSNWWDGTYVEGKSTGNLELSENVNSTVFNFTFYFDSDCDPGATLIIKTTTNSVEQTHTFTCSQNTGQINNTGLTRLAFTASALSATLTGNGVARYFVTGSSGKLPLWDCMLVCIFLKLYSITVGLIYT